VQITTIAEAEHSFQDNLLVAEKAAQATKKFFFRKTLKDIISIALQY